MLTQSVIDYQQILNMAYLLPLQEKKRLITDLQNNVINKKPTCLNQWQRDIKRD